MPKRTTEEGTLRNVRCPKTGEIVGFCFGVRLPRYRGNMLSLINGYYVNVDGEEFPQDAMRFAVNGKPPRTWAEIREAVWEHWNYRDTAYLYIEKPGGLAPGKHTVLAVVSNFEQYGYMPTDQERVDNVIVPTAAGTGFAESGAAQELELQEEE